MKYLKHSIAPIGIIVILLIVQAMSDLALPDYTSNIVNVGIQQNGIQDAVPEQIRELTLERLKLWMSAEEREWVTNYYRPSDSDTSRLVLVDLDKDTRNTLNQVLSKAMMIDGMLRASDSGAVDNGVLGEGMGIPTDLTLPEGMTFEMLLPTLPEAQIEALRVELVTKLSQLPDSILIQSAIGYVKAEYEAMGANLSALQNNYILRTGGMMLLIAFISMAAVVGVSYLASRVAARLGSALREKIFTKVVSFSNTEIDKFSTASLITRTTNDIQQVQQVTVMMLRIVFYAPILGLGGFLKVLQTETSMAWIIGVGVAGVLTLVLVVFAIAMPRFKRLQKLVDRVNLVMRELLTGMLVIRAFSTQKHEEARFDGVNSELTKTTLVVNRVMSMMMPMMMLIMNMITLLIVWNGAKSIDAGTMQVGNMMAFIQYTMQIIMSFVMISMFSIMLPRATVAAQRIEEVLNTEVSIRDTATAQSFEGVPHEGVVFENVSFSYPQADENVLTDISFTAKPGQTTAFIGSTGSGKSTLLNLIPRFYDVTEGRILIDGKDIRDVKVHDLRDKIGYVPQKGVLFSGTIASNLRYGNAEATDEDLQKVAEIAQATTFIEAKEAQFESEIAQGGTNVSGGQKQRLAIGRAIAKKPQIYLFDDSFSALDYKTDVALRRALKEETTKSTVLIVAQRISTILHADQIIVLDDGEVVGMGTHRELLASCEVYKEIASSQLSKEELAHE